MHTCVSSIARLCLTLCSPMDHSSPGSSVYGIFQARILEWVTISYSRGSSQPRDRTCVSCISCSGKWILYRATRETCVTNIPLFCRMLVIEQAMHRWGWGPWEISVPSSQFCCEPEGALFILFTGFLFSWALKSLQMVTAAMKLKDACCL